MLASDRPSLVFIDVLPASGTAARRRDAKLLIGSQGIKEAQTIDRQQLLIDGKDLPRYTASYFSHVNAPALCVSAFIRPDLLAKQQQSSTCRQVSHTPPP